MYALAGQLDPESIYQLARFAYAELAMAGVTAVGEFHYVHHQPGGQPYEERTALADAVIRAAQEVGIRINLQRVIYQRAGAHQELEPGQERFCDAELESSLADIDALRSRYEEAPLVNIGLAVHSVRAVSRPWIREASAYAKKHGIPMHMHLSEQRRELSECREEYGMTPVELMAEDEILDENFVAVHATHLSEAEIQALGAARSFVCVCRTTERDLGDGHCDARALLESGARLCTGVDSHALSDPFEECRAIELDQRSRDEARTLVSDATTLLGAASAEGYAAIGLPGLSASDEVQLRAQDPALIGLVAERLDDAVVFGASPRAVRNVSVSGTKIVSDGLHRDYEEIRAGYEECLTRLRAAIA
jgi:formiminoglutamate deiminase